MVSERRSARTRADHYSDLFGMLKTERKDPVWLTELRDAAIADFEARGFPLPGDEEWRFTPIGPIAETPFSPAPGDGADGAQSLVRSIMADLNGPRVQVVNGRYSGHSQLERLPQGVILSSLREALAQTPAILQEHLGQYATGGSSLTSLNTALMDDGVFLHIARGVSMSDPILIVYAAESGGRDAAVVSPRTIVVAEPGSSFQLIEVYAGAGDTPYWTNAVTEIMIGPAASVEHYRLQQEAVSAFQTGRTAVRQERDSCYRSYVAHTGGAIARHDLGVLLADTGSTCTLNGVYVGRGRQLIDNHTVIDHAAPHCESHELYKGILDDRAHGVFNGKVFVRQDAQKTDAKQSNQTLLLSEAAHIDTKPQLEIFADDVRCTHGATVGQLDAESLFYLRSRGLALDDARAILIHAFASEVIDRMNISQVRAEIESILLERLPRPSLLPEIVEV